MVFSRSAIGKFQYSKRRKSPASRSRPWTGLSLVRSDSVIRVKRGRFPQQDEQGTAASSLKRNLNVWSVDFKSRPPHACLECSHYYQVSFDWTTSFLSDALIINPEEGFCQTRF